MAEASLSAGSVHLSSSLVVHLALNQIKVSFCSQGHHFFNCFVLGVYVAYAANGP